MGRPCATWRFCSMICDASQNRYRPLSRKHCSGNQERRNPDRMESGRDALQFGALKLSRCQHAYFGLPRVCVRDILAGFSPMPFRQTIAAKIFGLAIILLLLTIALAGFLLYEVTRTKQDLTVVANFDVPLTQSLA